MPKLFGLFTRVFSWMFVAGLLAVTMVAVAPADAGTNLVVNGSFESVASGVSSPGAYICTGNSASCASGSTSNLTGWTSSCNNNTCGNGNSVGSILFAGTGGSAFNGGVGLNGYASNSADGGNFIGIDGDSTYTVSLQQSVSGLTVGSTYILSFYQAADQQAGSTPTNTTDRWQVSLGNSTQNSTLITDPNGSFTGWTLQTLSFVADATTDVLKFIALGTPNGVPPVALLDGVSLTLASALPVPEPAAWALLCVGLAGLAAVRSRRRASGRATV